ncbi:MAG: hypothetical protein Q4F72_09945 [Desulfovibrionaceae bacterium]|nr:hypothetical protein [Desulfovibrionaceae bacterium]
MSHAPGKLAAAAVCLVLCSLMLWGCSSKSAPPPDHSSRADFFPMPPDYRAAARRALAAHLREEGWVNCSIYVDPVPPEPCVDGEGRFAWRGQAAVKGTFVKEEILKRDRNRINVFDCWLTSGGFAFDGEGYFTTAGKFLLGVATLTASTSASKDLQVLGERYSAIRLRSLEADFYPGLRWSRDENGDVIVD